MINIKHPILIILIIIIYCTPCLCASTNCMHTSNNNLIHKKYLSAKNKLKNNNYTMAIKSLKKLNEEYPLNPYSNQIYFDLIYAYYKSMEFSLTLITINNFLKSNPNHPDLDYLYYIRGLSNMELDNNTTQKLFFLKKRLPKHNPMHALQAFQDFSQLINQYPNSQYILDAYKRLIYLKNRIADYELSIIKYYHQQQAYITVINRTEDMLRYFPDTTATRHALIYMHTAYQKLHLKDQANKITKIIFFNNEHLKLK